MSSRREEKERLRAERLAAEQKHASSQRNRLVAGYFVAGILAAAVIAGLVVVITSGGGGGGGTAKVSCDNPDNAHIQAQSGSFTGLEPDCREGTAPPAIQFGDLQESAQKAGCQLRLNLPDEGNNHVPNSTPVTYKTNPPTSGNHNPNPVADGAYLTPLSDDPSAELNVRSFIHSMEHGRVEVHYNPDLPENEQLAIKGVFDDDPPGMILVPDPNITDAVALTAWTQLATCPKYDPLVLDVIRNFRDTYRGNGPEQQIPVQL